MSLSSYLRASNTNAHDNYMNYRMNDYNSNFRDGHPGLINPLQVPDNSITMLVETGTFVDNEHADQPAQSYYTIKKLTHIGIRYLEVADDQISVTVGEVNGGVFNGYTRAPASHDRPDPMTISYTCRGLGGVWNASTKTWALQNIEIPLLGSLTTSHSTRAYYQIRPYHSYGYFVNLVMNDWDNTQYSSTSTTPGFLEWGTNHVSEDATERKFPTTQYAPIRDIIVSGSRMDIINLNCMQYLYTAYIAGTVTLKNYKIAGCPVLRKIGSFGLYGPRLPESDCGWPGFLGEFSFAFNPKLDTCPGLGDWFGELNMSSAFKNTSSLDKAPWIDMKNTRFGDEAFMNSYIRFSLPDYDYSSMESICSMYDTCVNLNNVPQLNMPKLRNASSAFFRCISIPTLTLNAPLVTKLSFFANGCTKLTTFNLIGGAKPTNLQSAFANTTALRSINLFDTSACTTIYSTFMSSGLTTLPAFNFLNVTTAESAFKNSKIASFSALNFSKAYSLRNTFENTPITTIPQITTSIALTNTSGMFDHCTQLTGAFDNYADTTPATHPNFNTDAVTNAGSMFTHTGLTRLEISLPKATNANYLCSDCPNLTTANVRFTDGVITDTSYMYNNSPKARWDNLNVTGYTSALMNTSSMFANIDWNTPDNTGTVFLNLPAAKYVSDMLNGVHGRQWIKLQNLSNLSESSGSSGGIFGTASNYPFNQFPSRKLWILNSTCKAVFTAWKELVNLSNLATATFEITLESVSKFDPAWLNNMVRLTKVTFINEPLDFHATAGLWVLSHNFQTNPVLTEINLQGSVTPEFVKALQVVAPVNVNYTGSITILHHNDLAWT